MRTVARFRCTHCRRTFSQQTFQTTYWLRRPELLHTICERLVAGSGLRQIARSLGCSATTVLTHAARLGRHLLLVLDQRRPRTPREPLVVDGFESFAFSQYHPLHLHLAVGADSHFVYGFTESELRRKGRMTASQKDKRQRDEARYGRPDPRAIEIGMQQLLATLVPAGAHAIVRSDEHPAYPRALRALPDRHLRHEVTSSKAARTTHNPLFPVNRQDLMLRHCGANHRRETIAYSKLRSGVIERAAIQVVWMNFVKAVSEKRPGVTPAMLLGLCQAPMTVRGLLRGRLFRTRTALPAVWRAYYERRVVTRRIPHSSPHERVFAD